MGSMIKVNKTSSLTINFCSEITLPVFVGLLVATSNDFYDYKYNLNILHHTITVETIRIIGYNKQTILSLETGHLAWFYNIN